MSGEAHSTPAGDAAYNYVTHTNTGADLESVVESKREFFFATIIICSIHARKRQGLPNPNPAAYPLYHPHPQLPRIPHPSGIAGTQIKKSDAIISTSTPPYIEDGNFTEYNEPLSSIHARKRQGLPKSNPAAYPALYHPHTPPPLPYPPYPSTLSPLHPCCIPATDRTAPHAICCRNTTRRDTPESSNRKKSTH